MPQINITIGLSAADLYSQRLLLCYLAEFDSNPERPIEGLNNLLDNLADALRLQAGETGAMLNGSATEDALGKRMVAAIRDKLPHKQAHNATPARSRI